MTDHDDQADPPGDFDARLSALQERHGRREETPRTGPSQASKGYKIVAEFVAGVLVGLGLGLGFDRLFATAPFGLLAFMLLGVAAGFYNVVRAGLAMGRVDETQTKD